MANWESLRVSDAIIQIKDEQLVLPVIQRRLVWSEEKMCLLFDSLLKSNSFGSIICIDEEARAKPLFAYRKFTDDGNPTQSFEHENLAHTHKLIIDGQQRLQSFYIGLCGTFNEKQLYFDLYSDYNNTDYDFGFGITSDKLPKINSEKSIKECLWYPVQDLYRKLNNANDDEQISDEIISTLQIQDEAKKKAISKNIRVFYNNIFSAKNIGLSSVPINKSKDVLENRQMIVELFRRLNDGGTKLSSFDLVASVLKGFDYKMEAFLDSIVEKHKDIGLSQETLIKLLFILNDQPQKEMINITAQDAGFATDNRERIEATLEALKKFLNNANMYNYFHTDKNRSFIPLYFIAYHIFHSQKMTVELETIFDRFDTNDADFINIKKWLCVSLLNGVFSRGRGWIPYKTGIRKIHEELKTKKGKSFPTSELFNMYGNHPLTFTKNITETTIEGFDKDAVFYMIYYGVAALRSEDIDHIHPKSLLETAGVDSAKINRVVNFQLLESGTNRGDKNGKELKQWIGGCVEPANRATYLDRHLIPTEERLWETANFKDFVVERAKLIISKLLTWCN